MPLFESFKTIPDYVGPPGIYVDETYTNLIDNPEYQRLKDFGIYLMSSEAATDFRRLLGNLTNSILNWTQTSVDDLLNFK
jgi:hypothetical protein